MATFQFTIGLERRADTLLMIQRRPMVVVMIVMMIRRWRIMPIRHGHISVHNRGPAPAHSQHRGRRHQQSSPALQSIH